MRGLSRNKRKMWYSLFLRTEPFLTADGDKTGENKDVYSEPKVMWANISAATGEAAAEAFGAFTDYSRTISVCDRNCPLVEGSRVWFGVEPPEDHNYVVVRVADSINSTMYALREVTVS